MRARPVFALLAAAGSAFAQQPLTIAGAAELALRSDPAIQVSREQIGAASAGIRLARTAYLPRIDAVAQVNRATRNNVFGALLPQSVLPPMSGPVLGTNNFGTAFGSALGGLVSWEPFDFGFRQAAVDAAAAARARSEASLRRVQFETTVAVADACLTLAAAEQTVRAAQAAVTRTGVIVTTTRALADAQLRPGADLSRALAEQAAAQSQRIQAEQAVEIARAGLSRFLGMEPSAIALSTPRLLELPPEPAATAPATDANPIILEQNATIQQLEAQFRTMERSWFPRFQLQAAAWARGSGAENNGHNEGALNGLAPTTQNYALGFTVTFPLMDRYANEAREAGQTAAIRVEAARSRQLAADLKARWNAAVATANGARRIAANTPVQIQAARSAVDQATARYQSGLGTIDSLAEAQRLLAQSEIDDALARLSVWRGLLAIAAAAGDMQPFLSEVSK